MLGRGIMYLSFGEELKTYSDTLGNQRYEIGQLMMLPDGRMFRAADVGGTTLVAGTLQQGQAVITNHAAQTIATATAVASTSINFKNAGTSVDFDEYRNGVIIVESGGTGKGFVYPFGSHSNVAASTDTAYPLQTGYGVSPATNTSDVATLVGAPWKYVVIAATAATGGIAGVALKAATTAGSIHATGGNAKGVQMGQLCWLQTAGWCPIRTDASTVVAGNPAIASASVAGDVALVSTTNVVTNTIVGWFGPHIAASTNWSPVFLTLGN